MKRKTIKAIILLGQMLLLTLCAMLAGSAAFTEKAETHTTLTDLANTEDYNRIMDYCALPDGRLVFCGNTEKADEEGVTIARLLCLNPDLSVCWEYSDPAYADFSEITAVDGETVAVFADSSYVLFFTADGQLLENKLQLPAIWYGGIVNLTSFGVLIYNSAENCTELTGWDGSVLFKAGLPECAWSSSRPVSAEDGLVLFGKEDKEPSEARATVMKIDLQGSVVWKTTLPYISGKPDITFVYNGLQTSDGGYLAVIWDYSSADEVEDYGTGHEELIRLDADGRLLWEIEKQFSICQLAEYDGKYVASSVELDSVTGKVRTRYLWMDTDGNDLGFTEFQLQDTDVPPDMDSKRISLQPEWLIPMQDKLLQIVTFWEPYRNDPDPEEPAWTQQDNFLIRVPER